MGKRNKDIKGKENAESKDSFSVSKWLLRLLYTVLFLFFSYMVILGFTIFTPNFMAYLIKGFGYTLENTAEVQLSLFAGLFFIAWEFLISYVIIKRAAKLYARGVKSTMSDEAVKRFEALCK